MSRLTRDGTAELVSRDQILRHERGQGNIHFSCSADHVQDWQPYPVHPHSYYMCDHTYIHTYIHTHIPVGPLVSTAAITTAAGINHVDSGRFSSRCCTFGRTHTSADPIRILCMRLALTSALSRPPGFAPCARLMVCVSPWALRLCEGFFV